MRFSPWLIVVPLAVMDCGSSTDASGGHFTVIDPGSGASNVRPLDPLPVGERRSDAKTATVVSAALQRSGVTVKQVVGGDGTVLWISENGDGQFLFGSSLDGRLGDPVLLVPAVVRMGMKWEASGYTFTVSDSKTMSTVFGAQTVWTIDQVDSKGAAVHREYIEGYGQSKVGFTTFSSFVIPLEAPPPAVDDDTPVAPTPLTGGATQLSVTAREPVFLSALDDGAGALTLGVTSLVVGFDAPVGTYVAIPSYDCSTFRGGALSAGCMLPTMPNADYSGAVRAGGKWDFPQRDGYGRPISDPGVQRMRFFRYLDAGGQVHDVGSQNGFPEWAVDFAGFTPLRGAASFVEARYTQFLTFSAQTYLPAVQVDGNGLLPFTILETGGLVTSSRIRFSGTGGHVEAPTAVGSVFGAPSVRTSPTEHEMLLTLADGTISRVQTTADGTTLETLAHVAVPAGQTLAGAVRVTRDGHARPDDPLLVAIYQGPPLRINPPELTEPKLYTTVLATVPQRPRPITTPPSLAVSALRVGVDAEICWPLALGTGLGSGWQLGGMPAAVTYKADQTGSCVLVVRDPSLRAAAASPMPPVDAWHLEGVIPGIGKTALAIGDARPIGDPALTRLSGNGSDLASLAGGGFVDTGGKIVDPDGLWIDDAQRPQRVAAEPVAAMPNGTGFLWLHQDDPSPGMAAAYLVGRSTRPLPLPAGACAMPPCLAGRGGVAVHQGGGYVVPIGTQPVLFALDGTATLTPNRYPFMVMVAPGVQIIASTDRLVHLVDGSFCSGSAASDNKFYLWCVDTAGNVRSADATSSVAQQARFFSFSDGTFLADNSISAFRFDATALTATPLDARQVAQVRYGADGSTWAMLRDNGTQVAAVYRVEPTGVKAVPGSDNALDFYVDEKFIFVAMGAPANPTSARLPRP